MSQKSRHPATSDIERLCGTDCGRPAFNAFLCRECSDELWRELLKVCEPARDANDNPDRTLVDELHLTITSCDRIAARNLGINVRSSATSLPWKEHAAEALRDLHSVLRGWVSTIAGYHGIAEDVMYSATDSANWLLRHHRLLGTIDIAGQAHSEIIDVIRKAEWAVDRPADRAYAGPCEPECGGEVYGFPGDNFAKCPECGAQYDAVERRDWLLKQSAHYLVTAAEASRALPDLLGRPLSVKTIRTWHNDKRLPMHGRDRDFDDVAAAPADRPEDRSDERKGAPLHRLGDIVDLALTAAIRNRQPKQHAASMAQTGASPPLCA